MQGFDLSAILGEPRLCGDAAGTAFSSPSSSPSAPGCLAMSLGIMLLVIRQIPGPIAERLVAGYVSYHRNVPTLVQLMLWYFGISALLPDRAAVLADRPQRRGDLRDHRARPLPGRLLQRGPALGPALDPRRPGRGGEGARPRPPLGDALRDDAAGGAQRAAGADQPQRLALQEQQPRDGDRRRRADPRGEGGARA